MKFTNIAAIVALLSAAGTYASFLDVKSQGYKDILEKFNDGSKIKLVEGDIAALRNAGASEILLAKFLPERELNKSEFEADVAQEQIDKLAADKLAEDKLAADKLAAELLAQENTGKLASQAKKDVLKSHFEEYKHFYFAGGAIFVIASACGVYFMKSGGSDETDL